MSYIRMAWPLTYFEGFSEEYVFRVVKGFPIRGKGKKWRRAKEHEVEDYGSKFEHDPSFAELLVRIVLDETGDEKFAWKVAGILAKKLKIKRRKKPLTPMQSFKLVDKSMKEDKGFQKLWRELK